ncbi:MAG TPA: hypothetical protein EYQ81_09070 [Sneathiellales bacterium]|nr:hypothetical protein [Sneathiellales bacterium]
MTNINNNFIFVRRALKSNSAISALAGMVMIATAAPLSQLLRIPQSWIVTGLGAGLILFAAAVYRHAHRPKPTPNTPFFPVLTSLWE